MIALCMEVRKACMEEKDACAEEGTCMEGN